MSTAEARRSPEFWPAIPILLGIFLVPLAQCALVYLSGHGGTAWFWLAGTPIAYFLIGGLGAFITMRGLVPAQARGRGSFAGLMAGIAGACSAGVILAAIIVWYIVISPQAASDIHAPASVMPRVVYFGMTYPGSSRVWTSLLLIIFVPIFLGVNLLGLGLASLGGMLGGYLRASISPRQAAPPEQPGERGLARSRGRAVAVVAIVAVIVALIVLAAGLFYMVAAF